MQGLREAGVFSDALRAAQDALHKPNERGPASDASKTLEFSSTPGGPHTEQNGLPVVKKTAFVEGAVPPSSPPSLEQLLASHSLKTAV